jgi:hypothetical protein
MKNLRSISVLSLASLAVLWFAPPLLHAQNRPTIDDFNGSYQGTAKTASAETRVSLEINSANGKVSGRAIAAEREYPIASGEIVSGKLVLKLGAGAGAGSLNLEKNGEKLVGDWVRGTEKSTVDFTKVGTTRDDISGDWDAAADAQGQAFPFTLSLKLEGEKVTGSSSSELGTSSISSGAWKEGKLVIVLESGAGQIGLVATLQDGKLMGDYDYAGQMQGKWVAVKKK